MSGKTGTIQPYVTIGTQKWQRRNLDVSTYRNGDVIPYVKDNTQWANLTTGAWCWYNNDPELGKIYGKLYNWYAVNDSRGLAPEGWHVPSNTEWNTLISYLGNSDIAGGAMKSTGTDLWQNPNTGATNSSGFNALPGGRRTSSFSTINQFAYFWSSTATSLTTANANFLRYIGSDVTGNSGEDKSRGESVRCIKD